MVNSPLRATIGANKMPAFGPRQGGRPIGPPLIRVMETQVMTKAISRPQISAPSQHVIDISAGPIS
jgi:hypothetical protein